jgi:hypothetical protein
MIPARTAPISLAVLASLALAACGSQGSVEAENESIESVAKKVDEADIRLKPGQWESTMTLESMDMPGMPPEARKMMESQKGTAHAFSHCLTPEDAAAPNAGFFQKDASGCTYDHFTMAGGRIDAAMTCPEGSGMGKMKMQGTYGPEAYALAIQSESQMQPGQPMKISMKVASRRTGDCTEKAN